MESAADFLERTKDQQPSTWLSLVVEAMDGRSGNALDLGCGAGRDTRFLLEKGFRVTAVDKEGEVKKYLCALPQEHLRVVVSRFEDFDFPENQYDLINASFSLPFTHREKFDEVFQRMEKSLRIGGVFVGQLFGVNDDWNKSQTTKTTFHTEEQARQLFRDWNVRKFIEKETDGVLANGLPKYSHVFHIIARRKAVEIG